jgi:hypothetical protein
MQLDVWIGFDDFLGKTDAECVEIMCHESVTKDHSLWNYTRVYQAFGLTVAEAVFQRLIADGMEAAALTYKDPGIDVSLDESQAALLSWGSDPVIGASALALRAIGVQRNPKWTLYGFPSAPTESDVSAARLSRTEKAESQQFSDEVWNALIRSGATKAQLKAAVAGW